MVDLNLRRLVIESLAAGILAYGLHIGSEATTDLSGGPLGMIVALSAV